MKCKVKSRFKEYVPGDCYAYTLECSCGEKFCGWIADEIEEDFKKHIEKEKK